ncbi:MAG: tripartite tricarboxylate transporter permease [Marinobacter sp.]|uniref:tripartite tricarboxylate transporter permease n=1 Tax=Marinobacter sp. TaxID=50741 RepID=UPI0034A096DC
MFEAAFGALEMVLDPTRLMILGVAVLLGLGIGVIPGLGGIVGLAILIPFTYTMDPLAAFAFLIGMGAVTTTSDTIPAVLFGVPGTSGSAATVVDGFPMAKNGEAGRAFGAAYMASLIGGVFGAILLALSIPVIRPMMLHFGSPELFMLTILGLTMVAALSGKAPMRGIAAGAIGLVIAMIGLGSQGGSLRWTFDQLYFWDGLPLVPLTLGLFALPELIDMAIARTKIARNEDTAKSSHSGQMQGIRDVFKNWWLTLRCGALGAGLGAVPGLGSAVVDWLAYGHAKRSEKNTERFGFGDVRGVIGPESANNAKTGGALVPTLAFGVPGSASMALLLGAFLMHGLVPGPEMLTTNLDITYGIIWSLALANILGAGLCLIFADQFAKVALIRFGILVPVISVVVFLGAYQGSASWGDIMVLLGVGAVGWIMKQLDWPRPPLLLGFVLGEIFERYLWISVNTSMATSETGSAFEWITRPLVVVLIALTVWGLFQGARPWLKKTFMQRGETTGSITWCAPRVTPNSLFSGALLIFFGVLWVQAGEFSFNDRVVPLSALGVAIGCTALSFIASTFTRQVGGTATIGDVLGEQWVPRLIKVVGWLLGFTALIWLIGFLPAIFVFIFAFTAFEGKESYRLAFFTALGTALFSYLVFHMGINVNWPNSVIGDVIPALRDLTRFL